jgi:sugar lactone lactonase YvrE
MWHGFIVCVDAPGGAAIVADVLGHTNEVALDADGQWLYVNETFGRRVSRLRVRENGALGPRETFASLGEGTYPDGLAFDETGHLWVVSIVSNRLIRIAPDGSQRI